MPITQICYISSYKTVWVVITGRVRAANGSRHEHVQAVGTASYAGTTRPVEVALDIVDACRLRYIQFVIGDSA